MWSSVSSEGRWHSCELVGSPSGQLRDRGVCTTCDRYPVLWGSTPLEKGQEAGGGKRRPRAVVQPQGLRWPAPRDSQNWSSHGTAVPEGLYLSPHPQVTGWVLTSDKATLCGGGRPRRAHRAEAVCPLEPQQLGRQTPPCKVTWVALHRAAHKGVKEGTL